MAESSTAADHSASHITEAEAAVYDRQIRLWGLEAQQRMRSSTILIVNLRSLAQETIKNLVLAGIGRLIVMDDEDVSEEDLGAGFLFRELDGVVGKKRVDAALPQIQSLNPLVEVTPIASTHPFILTSLSASKMSPEDEMEAFLKREKVDLVCVTDASRADLIRIDKVCRMTNTLFYGSGGYGTFGYILADLGENFEWVSPSKSAPRPGELPKMVKSRVSCPSIAEALRKPPFKGLAKRPTIATNPAAYASLFALWDWEARHDGLPNIQTAVGEMSAKAESLREEWAVLFAAVPHIPHELLTHLALHATYEFAPTSAILGGILGQDILRALSRKETPILNFLVFDGASGGAWTTRWGVGKIEEVA